MLASSSRCKHCKVKFSAEDKGKRLHAECVDPWMAAFRLKQAAKAQASRRAKAKVERAETRKRKAALKKHAQWHAEAQTAVNAFIRARDTGLPCVSCGTPWQSNFQAGHYRSRGAAKNLALDPRNIHGQCVQCNLHKHSNAVEYRIRLVERFGAAFVEAIECDNAPRHYSPDDLEAIKQTYRAKLRELNTVTAGSR